MTKFPKLRFLVHVWKTFYKIDSKDKINFGEKLLGTGTDYGKIEVDL